MHGLNPRLDCVQWNLVYGFERLPPQAELELGTTRSVGQYLSYIHWATGAPTLSKDPVTKFQLGNIETKNKGVIWRTYMEFLGQSPGPKWESMWFHETVFRIGSVSQLNECKHLKEKY